ncbi:hypothetical protein OAT67_09145, partial [Bacteriovoracaceae bacterium]|nr:hypothetical protein [Bacteriovoracaceae bacterium]
MKSVWISIYLLLFLFASCNQDSVRQNARVPSSSKVYDIVFDLDWTLIYKLTDDIKVPKSEQHKLFFFENERFIIADEGLSVLDEMAKRPDVRISFYKGGSKERSELWGEVELPSGKKIKDITYKSLSFDDLQKVPGIPEDEKFFKRFNKNLSWHFPDIENTLIIDDQVSVPDSQRKSLIFLEETYNWYPRFEDSKRARLDPTDPVRYKIERNKIVSAYQEVVATVERANESGSNLYEVRRPFSLMGVLKEKNSCNALFLKIV